MAWKLTRENRNSLRETIPSNTFSPQSPHGLLQKQTKFCAARNRC